MFINALARSERAFLAHSAHIDRVMICPLVSVCMTTLASRCLHTSHNMVYPSLSRRLLFLATVVSMLRIILARSASFNGSGMGTDNALGDSAAHINLAVPSLTAPCSANCIHRICADLVVM